MGIDFTNEQRQVIDLRDRNILVSAAAGSGKTAVLVERIIKRLTKDPIPMDVDQLLVMTFTEAAAAEMKERIHKALEAALEEKPDDLHLQRQATLVHRAQITTIHGFCLSVIREYFHAIDLEPGFRTGEENEIKLLKKDVLETVLEQYYAEGRDAFYHFVECFASGKDDTTVEDIVLQLYDNSRSHPNPDAWLDSCVDKYDIKSVDELEQSEFAKNILLEVKKILGDFEGKVLVVKDMCLEEDGPVEYIKALDADIESVRELGKITSYTAMSEALSNFEWEKFDNSKSEKKKLVQKARNKNKEIVTKIKNTYFFETPEVLQQEILATKEHVTMLVELVKAFAKAFQEKKQDKGIIDFNDMEHYALEILTTEENGKVVPSAIAKEYQQKFREIMIDEYQDSNMVQETILTSVSTNWEGKNNVFMVGDVKQSIYSFRMTRPELFMEKYNSYSTSDSDKQRIDLCKNFRSRKEVLDSCNFVFEQIMTEKLGGIVYDDKAALYVGAKYDAYPDKETEICLVDAEGMGQADDIKALEAIAVAKEIKELVGKHIIYDKEADTYREAEYRDIVILFRATKDWADIYQKVLMSEGVPVHSVSKTGYFKTKEVYTLLDYLRILDNPHQDIPFVAVLRSAFLGVSSEELAIIQTTAEGSDFYEKTCRYAKNGTEDLLRKKVESFLNQYQTMRQMVPYTGIHELLWKIMDDTGYANYMAALPGGEQRKANLDMLIEKAIAFEATSYKGLFHFIRYIEQLDKHEEDFGEASIMDESTNVVRIMTIHGSKGLEFPIVFVGGMNKQFNFNSTYGSVILHSKWGIGMNMVDVVSREKSKTLLQKVVEKELQKDCVAEELRLLYVAMTRAKEKLFMIGSFGNLKEKLQSLVFLGKYEGQELPYTQLSKQSGSMMLVLAALYRNQAMKDVLQLYDVSIPAENPLYNKEVPIIVRTIPQENLLQVNEGEKEQDESIKKSLEGFDTSVVYDASVKEQLEEQFSYQYPYEGEQNQKQKITVSDLKKRIYLEEEEIEEETVIPLLPKFLQDEIEMTGAARGTAYHKVMELIDLEKDYDLVGVENAIQQMVQQSRMTPEMAQCVQTSEILKFLNSLIGKRVQQACKSGVFHREQPFVLGDEELASDITLVQGIIDAYFEEEGEIVVLDYKTDKVWKEDELKERYRVQLDYYAKALNQITGKPVKEKKVYSFALGREIEV